MNDRLPKLHDSRPAPVGEPRDSVSVTHPASAARPMIENPILPGFNPDPSILRVEDDYYIATSTFEWFPGVQIHHSRDLVNWRLLTRPLTRTSQLDLRGNPRSGGVWAPCLSYSGGTFYLVYTDTKNWGFGFMDTHNYVVTASSILGPWSDPVPLNSSGFDPSLFHDDDGKKWLLNMLWDFRPGKNHFAGVVLQEFDADAQKLVGPVTNICRGSSLGATEGPHLYKHNGVYYLLLAEGGTSWDHAVTVGRSHSIFGPYELDPEGPMLTSKGTDAGLQKAGHASLVATRAGETYLAHLCARPTSNGRCSLGRETALQKVHFTSDGWLRLAGGGHSPQSSVEAPDLPPQPFPHGKIRDHFDAAELAIAYQTLRAPADSSWLDLTTRPGHLRLVGRESPGSLHNQSLVARRLDATSARCETKIEFEPDTFQQFAGLVCLYDDQNYFSLAVTHDEEVGKCLYLHSAEKGKLSAHLNEPVPLPRGVPVVLRAEFDRGSLAFSWSIDNGHTFTYVPVALDATKLSDEYNTMELGFTGTFVGMSAHDLSGQRRAADFDYFDYEPSDLKARVESTDNKRT